MHLASPIDCWTLELIAERAGLAVRQALTNKHIVSATCIMQRLYCAGTSRLCHPPALFGTLAASLGAALAVIHLMLGTFICARLANICAQATKRLGEFTVPGHIAGRDAANLRAIHVQLYTTRHAFNILFPQA